MPLNLGQVSVASTVPVLTINIPPGPWNLTLYNTNSTSLYMAVGTSPTTAPNLTSTNGLVMHSIPTSFNGYQGSNGGYLWVMGSATTPTSFNYVLSEQQH